MGEQVKLGNEISGGTVLRLLSKDRKPSSQAWRALLNNYLNDSVSIDFFTSSTIRFRLLFVFVVLSHV